MIELIAVHMGATFPVVLEFETGGLNYVQRSALEKLPRSPSGVPELRALGKADGGVTFKFSVAPDKVAAASIPAILTIWEEKFTAATLKLMAKKAKAERDAATAAGLWKEGMEKGDLNAMHQNFSPEESAVFQETLAQGKQKKPPATKNAKAGKRSPKPKLLAAVIDATSTVNPLTGERVEKLGASESAVTTLRAQEMVADLRAQLNSAANFGERQEFADPLEVARQAASVQTTAEPDSTQSNDTNGLPAQFIVQVGSGTNVAASTASARAKEDSAIVKKKVQAHREGKIKGAKLVEMSVQDLFKHLESETPGVFTAKENSVHGDQTAGSDFNLFEPRHLNAEQDSDSVSLMEFEQAHQAAWDSSDDGNSAGTHVGTNVTLSDMAAPGGAEFEPFFEFDELAPSAGPGHSGIVATDPSGAVQESVAPSQPVTVSPETGEVDWSGLMSFRLDNHRDEAQAVLLETGEIFEALAYIKVEEPLSVTADWLLDAVSMADMVPTGGTALAEATGWLRAELIWRHKELVRWLGKTDLVTSPVSPLDEVVPGEKVQRIINAKKRPPNWVAKGCHAATLAQSISLDIALLDMVARDVERAQAGMPAWAIDAMQNMLSFKATEAAQVLAITRTETGAAFRDVWREELQRIDRWCAAFANIKIARQIGLFGSESDQKLLVRLEQLIERTRAWRAAPAQASRVLAVWLAFVLSLDHENRPVAPRVASQAVDPIAGPESVPAPTCSNDAPRARRGRTSHAKKTSASKAEVCHA